MSRVRKLSNILNLSLQMPPVPGQSVPESPQVPQSPLKARVLYDFEGDAENGELVVREGDILTVENQDVGIGWWEGLDCRGVRGLFPAAYVELIDDAPPARPPPLPPQVPSQNYLSVSPQYEKIDGRGTNDWDDDWDDRSSTSDSRSGDYNFGSGPGNRSTSVSMKRAGTISRSMNRFSNFVKSGGEAFLLGSSPDVPVGQRDCVIIVDGPDGVMWQPSGTPFTVSIMEPEKKSKYKGMKSYIAYTVLPTHTGRSVSHRFKHFDWLYARLVEKYPCISVPPLPDKQLTGRYAEEFIQKRKFLLQQWINRIARHPVLRESEVLQNFLTVNSETQEKEWKANKRKAETDKLVGTQFFHTIDAPSQNMSQQKVDTQIEQFKDAVKTMDESIKAVIVRCEEHWDKCARSYKNEYKKFAYTFNTLSTSFATDNAAYSLPLTQAIEHTGKTYDDIGEICQEQPRRDMVPMIDLCREYLGILSTFPEIITVHKGAMGKVRECQKLQEEDKLEYTTVAEVTSRLDVVTNGVFAEINHFQRERVRDYKAGMKLLLQEQINFHQEIINKLQTSLSMYDHVPD